ncbi:uncharacterized protein G2W53_044535 [Senna tora]|uniref:Uncharacterized protein n=1 Tax=Senna tora TaxID=362788 RepID=A0A834VX20_9FABA|nr:uncharacterized protein G2W53_044535 [Senna tora]
MVMGSWLEGGGMGEVAGKGNGFGLVGDG